MQRFFPLVGLGLVILIGGYFLARYDPFPANYKAEAAITATTSNPIVGNNQASARSSSGTLDKALYDRLMLALVGYTNVADPSPIASSTASSTTVGHIASSTKGVPPGWPAKTVYPNGGALLPFNRIVAYYGNFYSTQMGILGEYSSDVVLQKLEAAAAQWAAADPITPVIPAIDYIAVTAQGSPGPDGMYRLRMPVSQIQQALDMANKVHGELILDVQVGKSTLQQELPLLADWFKQPNVHLAIDPEFSMKGSEPPGTIIGTYNSSDINYAVQFLDTVAAQNNLPPKILIVHRFTEDMVTGYRNIKPTSNVEIVMDMDGWGFPAKKINTYEYVIVPEPVQFTGFKLFYKADLRPPSTRMLTPAEVLSLKPHPIFIQYQ